MNGRPFPAATMCRVRHALVVLFLLAHATATHAQCNFDVDGNGVQDGATDGLMLMRYQMGLRGAALIGNAFPVSPAPTRVTAADIENYLTASDYDIDGDSQRNALSDGLLVFRYLAGIRGAPLINGIGASNLTRGGTELEFRMDEIHTRDNAALPCRLALIGVTALQVGATNAADLYAAAGTRRHLGISFQTKPAADPAQITFSILSGNAFAAVQSLEGAWGMTLDATALAAGASGNFVLRVTNGANGRFVDVPAALHALGPTFASSGLVSASGGTLATSSGANIVFPPSSLASPIAAQLTETTTPDGSTLMRVTLDAAASGSDLQIILPGLNDEPDFARPVAGRATPAKGSALAACIEVGPLQQLIPYCATDKSLAYKWRYFDNYVLDEPMPHNNHRIPELTAIKTDDFGKYIVVPPFAIFDVSWEKKVFGELHSVIPRPSAPLNFDANTEPVLFVNGFAEGATLGGSKTTWAQFPALLTDAPNLYGRNFIPFEFRWQSDAHFIDAAADLARAIMLIKVTTGKRVHVVAHSFGGVLVRTLLQGQTRGLPPGSTIAADARAAIASLLTIGTPHSGIAGAPLVVDGVTLPVGRDSTSLFFCMQVSCHVVGKVGVITDPKMRGVLGVGEPGELSALLAKRAALAVADGGLPSLPITVGIGLTNNRSGSTRYDAGDYLISYQGQRFAPSDAAALDSAAAPVPGTCRSPGLTGGIEPLRSSAQVGQANVTEVILGVPRDVRPGDLRLASDSSDGYRYKGYLHAGITGVSNFLQSDGSLLEFWGLEVAPVADCANGSNCRHAGFQLFKTALAPQVVAPQAKIFGVVAARSTLVPGLGATFVVDAYLPEAFAGGVLRLRTDDGSNPTQMYMQTGRHTYLFTMPTNLWYSERDSGGVTRTMRAEIVAIPSPAPALDCTVRVEGLPPLPTVIPTITHSAKVCGNNGLGLNSCAEKWTVAGQLQQGGASGVNGSPWYQFLVSFGPGGSACEGTYIETSYWPPVGFQSKTRTYRNPEWYWGSIPEQQFTVASELSADSDVKAQNPSTFTTDWHLTCTAKFVLTYGLAGGVSQTADVAIGHTVVFTGIP